MVEGRREGEDDGRAEDDLRACNLFTIAHANSGLYQVRGSKKVHGGRHRESNPGPLVQVLNIMMRPDHWAMSARRLAAIEYKFLGY